VAARGPRSPGGELEVTPTFRIPIDELAWRFTGSGGPGGQHANTSNTRVELSWDVAASAAPGPRQRALLLERLGRTVRVVVAAERSQARNRELALERLQARVASALRVDPPRRPTRPTRASTERRLDAKRRHAQRKRDRRGDQER
jgi:ribosome-associated protein